MTEQSLSIDQFAGRLLKRKRSALLVTQNDLAKRCGVSVNTVSRWERGAAHIPGMVWDTLTVLGQEQEAVNG